jgi:hypothetical protein
VEILAPGIQPRADPLDGIDVPADHRAATQSQREQRQWPADSVRHAEVGVATREVG